jgi:hypothetical protein
MAVARVCRAALLAAALGACAPAVQAPGALPAGEAIVADRLFFGRDVPGGEAVSEEAWSAFLREVVTPRFPDGLTVWRGEGQWRNAAGETVREGVFVVEVFHPGGPAADLAILEIAAEYRRRFGQESVLRVTSPARWRFLER